MNKIIIICLIASSAAMAQKKAATPISKKPLSNSVYDQWKDISYKSLTNDGTHAAFLINPQDGDGKAVFYQLATSKEDSVKRATDIQLTFDSKQAIFKIKPEKEKVKDLRRQKKKKEDLPKDSLGIFTFSSRKTEKIPEVKSFQVPEKAGNWLAYLLEAKKEDKKQEKEKGKEKEKVDTVTKSKSEKVKKPKKNSDDNGYTLVVKKLSTNADVKFGFVKEYSFAKYGQGLLFATTGNDSTMKPGVYWYDLQNEKLQQLHEGKSKHKYQGLAISEDGTQAGFLVDADTTKALVRYFKLYHWKTGETDAKILVDETTEGMPINNRVSEHFTPIFSKDGSKLFLGVVPKGVVADTTRLDEEVVKVEVWNWRDSVLQTQQNKQLETEKKRSYRAVVNLPTKKLVALSDERIPELSLADEGNAAIALGLSSRPYRWHNFYDITGHQDAYILNVSTGQRKKALTKIKGNISVSPKANYLYWFSLPDTAWFTYHLNTQTITNHTKKLDVPFADEEDDQPDYPSPYGIAGWLENDQRLLVYDRYDIWSLDPENKTAPKNLTKIGRSQKNVFRYLKLDQEERFIKSDAELLLSSFNETTKQWGYYKLSLKSGELKLLLTSAHQYGGTTKAKQANRLLFTRQNFNEFPDVWVTDLSFTNPKKLTTANPQMKNYLWGSVELVNWHSLDNVPLQGLLYKPENFDPSKKYPMIVYFYDRSSDELHGHYKPQPSWSIVQRTVCVSNGYVVFVPDIVYKIGSPGESAYNAIMPGVTNLISKGFVDEKNIGIQGQSWGGYQTAYIITRTNLFKAAGAGAAVVNMTSAYGGIRWGTGISRMFQYEHSQSRIGGTLWEKPLYYLENSPLFSADKIQTPVLIMQNDKDDAVPWYQGIEFYMALRRLQKPVWMLVYNEEVHNLQQRQNRMDYDRRLMQFFDHYLKGSPEPAWMKEGIPAIEKGITKGY
jgi:dipeptidyl aminopeptidase/acylaminoacyl peptidase